MNPDLQEKWTAVQNRDAALIDIRESEEWEEGTIEGAILWPLSEIRTKNERDDLVQDKPLYLYCRNANRVREAEQLLRAVYPKAEALPYGFDMLCLAGLPVTEPS